MSPLFLYYLSYFLFCFLSLTSSRDSSSDHVDPNDLHISDLLVSQYDCSKQHNLRQFSLTRIQPCSQASSSFESTRAIVNVRAKYKRLKAWTCELYVKREKFVCAESDCKYRRHDRTDYHQNTMERPRTLDPTECKYAIRHLSETNNPQLDAFNYTNSFTFFNDFQKQRLLETIQPPSRITKLDTFHYSAFAWIANSQLVLDSTLKEKAVCWERYEYIIEKDSWSLIVKEIEITYDDKNNKLIYHGHTLPCLHDDGFSKPTLLTPFTIVWFPEELCSIFSILSFMGRMSKLNNRYWLETEHFFNSHSSTTSSDTPYHDTKSHTCLSRFEIMYVRTVMYGDPITRQTFEHANQIPCENSPQNVISLDPDTDQYYVLTPQPIKKDPPLPFEPTQVPTAISPNTFTAQDAGIYSQKELKHLWNRVLFTKHSDNTLQLLGKAISYEFMNQKSSGSLSDNPYRSLRIGLHDYMLNLTPFFSPDWFTEAFIKFFGYPCYILTQCGTYFSTAVFLHFAFNTLISIYCSFTVRNLLKKQISVISALGFGFFGTITQTMMTAMIKSSDSHSDSEDSDSPQSPPSNSHSKSLNPKPKSLNYQSNIKTKLLSLEKNLMHRSSPTKPLSSAISQSYPISNTPPPPNYNSQNTPHNNLSPRHS